jgi:branched-chain amino acid transport system substrate-binding protein
MAQRLVPVLRRRRASVLALTAGICLLVSACSSSSSGGSSGSSDTSSTSGGSSSKGGDIEVGGMLSITAAGSNSGPALVKGANARFAQVNAAGGIDGHMIKLNVADDQLDPAKAPSVMRTLVESKHVLATIGTGSADGAAVQPYLKQMQVLGVPGGSSTSLIAAPGSTYRLDKPDYFELAARDVQYAVQVMHKKKVAVAYTDDAVGQPVLAGVKAELAKLGMKTVAVVKFSPTDTSVSTQAAKLKASGADFVVINHVPSVMSLIFKADDSLGYKPDYGATFAGENPSIIQVMGKSLNNRIIFATSFPVPTSSAAADFRTWVAKGGGDISDANTLIGWTNADAVVAVMEQAVKAAGGVPSHAQVMAAASNITIKDNYIPGATWTKTGFYGPHAASIDMLNSAGKFVKVQGVEPAPVTDSKP